MKTTKRTIGAFAFLAALVMIVSVMTPLADAGADNSAPVLFSNESEASSDRVLGTWTSNEGSFYLTYTETPGAKYPYMLTFTLNPSFPLTEFQTVIKFSLNDNLSSKPIMTGSFAKKHLTDSTSPKLGLTEKLVSGKYTFTVSDPNAGHGGSDFSDFVEFTIGASADVITSNYFESAESAKTAINAVWDGSDITDVADKTMFVIYEQVGTFDKDVIGELYFNDQRIYFETLNNKEGQRIWYFTFDQPNANGKSIPYAPGNYTMKLVSDGVVITETTAKISGTVPQKLIIEAEAGKGGSISPEGKVEVTAGGNQTFTITPDSGYEVDKVLVDNEEVSLTDGKYTFSDVDKDHKISVTFKKSDSGGGSGGGGVITTNYTITATAGSGGKINPSGNVSVKAGDSKTFTITCDSGYEVDKVLVDNKEASLTDGKYTFSNVTENHSIKVTFKESGTVPQKLIIEAEAGKGGSISPEGKVEVTAGGNQTFTITPDSGYEVDKVLVDNEEVSLTDGKYTFSNVTENHSIKVTFKESGETPTPSGDSGKNNTIYYIIAAIIAILIIIAIVYFFMKK